jgi:hypothetical protein
MELKEILYDGIYYYTNVFEEANKILSTFEELDSIPESYSVIEKWAPDNSERLRKNIYTINGELEKMPDGPLKEKLSWLINTILNDIKKVAKHFYEEKKLSNEPNVMESLHICKYEPGGGIGFHFDAEVNGALLYTIAIYWNNDYQGGELAFQLANVSRKELNNIPIENKIIFNIKPEAGSVLIFPATAPYFHSSLPLKEGFKYFTGSAIYVDGFDHMNLEHIERYRIKADGE